MKHPNILQLLKLEYSVLFKTHIYHDFHAMIFPQKYVLTSKLNIHDQVASFQFSRHAYLQNDLLVLGSKGAHFRKMGKEENKQMCLAFCQLS